MKRIKILLTVCLLLLTMTGCQLARTDVETTGDQLVGVLMTKDYLDLFDMEAYLNDNLHKVGSDLVLDGDTSEYQGRIYASLTSGDNGMDDTIHFADLEGIHLIAARMQNDNEETYNRVYSNDGISNVKTAYKYTDTEESVSIEAKIWMAHRPGSLTTYFNPIYQDSEGNFYVMPGSGFSTNGDNADGGVYSQTMEDSRTVTVGGETTTRSVSITVSFGTMYEPNEYVILQMNENHEVLSHQICTPGEMPEELTLSEETAYVILENHQANDETEWELLTRDTDMMITYYVNADGYLVEDYTPMNWK